MVIQGAFNIGEPRQMRKLHDLTGQKFGELTVIQRAENQSKKTVWLCKCDCGNIVKVVSANLISGNTKSCGCLKITKNTKHGDYKSKLYHIHHSMFCRCYNHKDMAYKWYGAKGITVCEEWKEYSKFKEWATHNGYKEGLSIDRIDSDKNYCPENCRWVTLQEQAKNKKEIQRFEYKGNKYTVGELSNLFNISRHTLYGRLNRGWSFEDAITIPIRKCSRITKAEEE